MATHSSVLAWRIPGTVEPGGLLSMGVTQSQTQLKRLSSSSSSKGYKLLEKGRVFAVEVLEWGCSAERWWVRNICFIICVPPC